MTQFGILITVLLFLTSCSVVAPVDRHLRGVEARDKTEMFNIVISRWEKQEYSGLLIIKSSAKGIHYILLDPTGIKLLESEIVIVEQVVNETPGGPLAGRGINKFLTRAIWRIMLQMPDELPCMRNGLSQFCYTVDPEGGWEKKYKFGPLSIWRAEKKIETTAAQYEYFFTQPWLGVNVELKRLESVK